MSAGDYLKIGELIQNHGQFNSQQLIPSWYFNEMTKVSNGVNKLAAKGTSQTRAYSTQLTTNMPIMGRELAPEYPKLPSDSLLLIGHQGQLLIVSPSQKLIILRLATDSRSGKFERRKFLAQVEKLIGDQQYSNSLAEVEYGQMYNLYPKTEVKNEKSKSSFVDKLGYVNIPTVIQRIMAKEFCSCLKVLKRSRKQCREDMKHSLPLQTFVSESSNKIKAGFLPLTFSKTTFVSEKLGCQY